MRKMFLAVAALAMGGCAAIRPMPRYTDPLTGAEHLQLAATYEAKGEMGPAEREYRAATRRDKKNLAAYIGLGNAAFAQGHMKEAELAFLRALRLSKKNPAASNNLAMLYASQGRKLKTAERLALRAAEDKRFRPYALDTLATIYGKQGRREDAANAITEAGRHPPADDPAFLTNLAKTAARLGL